MPDPERFIGVPQKVYDDQFGSPPRGRLRLDMSVTLGNLVTLLLVLGALLILGERVIARVDLLDYKFEQYITISERTLKRLEALEREQIKLRQDLSAFPLHRHIDHSRVEIFPDRPARVEPEGYNTIEPSNPERIASNGGTR